MATRSTPVPAVKALDPHHPLIRRLLRSVQLRDYAITANPPPTYAEVQAGRLAHVGGLLLHVCQHIATARPRVECDEAAQLLITGDDGAPIGRLRRPAAVPDMLHPAIEAAINAHLDGDDGREGDADAEAEGVPAGVVEAVL